MKFILILILILIVILFTTYIYMYMYMYIYVYIYIYQMDLKAQRVSIISIMIAVVSCSNLRSEWPIDQQISLKSDDDPGAAFLGFVVGPIAFALSFVMIWYNQKRAAINTTRLIKITQLLSTSKQPQPQPQPQTSTEQISQKLLPSSNHNHDPTNLIYVSGSVNIEASAAAQDPVAKLLVEKCLRLDRTVEVMEYRTVSNKKNQAPQLGWYSYHMAEASGRQNDPANWFLKSQTFTAKEATVEGYKMNQKQMKTIPTNSTVTPTEQIAKSIKQQKNRPNSKSIIQGDYIYFPAVDDNKLSHGSLRLKYTTFKPDVLSIIASHTGPQLQPFRIDLYQNKGQPDTLCCQGKSCCCMCNAMGELMKPISQVDFVMEGKKTQGEMIQSMIAGNKALTNILRIVAYFVMVLGIYAFFSPIVELLGYIPLVGGFLKGAAGTIILLAALIICIPLFLLTFSLAWLVYHPKTGILFVLLSAVLITIIVVLNQVYSDK